MFQGKPRTTWGKDFCHYVIRPLKKKEVSVVRYGATYIHTLVTVEFVYHSENVSVSFLNLDSLFDITLKSSTLNP